MNNRVHVRALRHSTTAGPSLLATSSFFTGTHLWLYHYYIVVYFDRLFVSADLKKKTVEDEIKELEYMMPYPLTTRQKRYVRRQAVPQMDTILVGRIHLEYRHEKLLVITFDYYWDQEGLSSPQIKKIRERFRNAEEHLSVILGCRTIVKAFNIMENLWQGETLFGEGRRKKLKQERRRKKRGRSRTFRLLNNDNKLIKELLKHDTRNELLNRIIAYRYAFDTFDKFRRVFKRKYRRHEYFKRLHKVLFTLLVRPVFDSRIFVRAIAYEFSILRKGHLYLVKFLKAVLRVLRKKQKYVYIRSLKLIVKGRLVLRNRQTPRKKKFMITKGGAQRDSTLNVHKDEDSAIAVSRFGVINVKFVWSFSPIKLFTTYNNKRDKSMSNTLGSQQRSRPPFLDIIPFTSDRSYSVLSRKRNFIQFVCLNAWCKEFQHIVYVQRFLHKQSKSFISKKLLLFKEKKQNRDFENKNSIAVFLRNSEASTVIASKRLNA